MALVAYIFLDHAVADRFAGNPSRLRRQSAGIDAVEVPAGGQEVDAARAGRAGRTRRHISAGKRGKQMIHLVRCPCETRVNFFDDEFCQRLELFFPFGGAVRRLGYFQSGLRRFRSEAAFGDFLDENAALASYTVRRFAAGHVEIGEKRRRILFQFLEDQPVFLRPEVIKRGRLPVGQAQKVQNLADEYFSLRRLAEHMQPDVYFTVL